jgi:hypothetical protein
MGNLPDAWAQAIDEVQARVQTWARNHPTPDRVLYRAGHSGDADRQDWTPRYIAEQMEQRTERGGYFAWLFKQHLAYNPGASLDSAFDELGGSGLG